MKYYDITQEIFTCSVYPGDKAPEKEEVQRTSRGDLINLTNFAMCAHNGTHVDAPFHFLGDGGTVEQIPLEKTVGPCYVVAHEGDLTADAAAAALAAAREVTAEGAARLLFKGQVSITPEGAAVLAESGLLLVGVEPQSVAATEIALVHRTLLSREIVLLEGIRLGQVPEGAYLLSAAPIPLGGCDGAPCRAVLMEG